VKFFSSLLLLIFMGYKADYSPLKQKQNSGWKDPKRES